MLKQVAREMDLAAFRAINRALARLRAARKALVTLEAA